MIAAIGDPPASADPIRHADSIELDALLSRDKSCSFQDYARNIRLSGTTDALTDVDFEEDPGDKGGEQSDAVATDAWDEIEQRWESCGRENGHYPFEVSETRVALKDEWPSSPYIFQLLLGQFGHTASTEPMNGARLFENLCSRAARGYLGGEDNCAIARSFGFPRSDGTNFRDALQSLCSEIGEGEVETSASRIEDQKDSHLDVVAWLPFCDRRSAQLIAFGQCATGEKWDGTKLSELVPTNFNKKWLRKSFSVDPIRMFFIPRTIENSKWRNAAIDGGIVFDRCRISWCAGVLTGDLEKELATWIDSVYSEYMSEHVGVT